MKNTLASMAPVCQPKPQEWGRVGREYKLILRDENTGDFRERDTV